MAGGGACRTFAACTARRTQERSNTQPVSDARHRLRNTRAADAAVNKQRMEPAEDHSEIVFHTLSSSSCYSDAGSSTRVPPSSPFSLRGSVKKVDEESASLSSDSLSQRSDNSCNNSIRFMGYVICALAIACLLTIVSFRSWNRSFVSSSQSFSHQDIGSRITISAAAAAAFSSADGAENSNELNRLSGDLESKSVTVESKCSKFIGSMDEGAFSFKVRFSMLLMFSALLFHQSLPTISFPFFFRSLLLLIPRLVFPSE